MAGRWDTAWHAVAYKCFLALLLTTPLAAWYRVRFEAIGTQLRVYINEVLRLEAVDSSHATGRYGAIMYKTTTQYDDIVAVEP